MAEERSKVDWEAVEKLYRAGLLSLREIGKAHAVSEGMIRKKAKQLGWQRDLTARVEEKVRNELVRDTVRNVDPRTDAQIVEEAAAAVVLVVREHKTRIRQGHSLVELLTNQLTEAAGMREELESEIEDMTEEDRTNERRAKLMKAVSIGTHASTALNLANAAKIWIGLERQAFSIKDDTAHEEKPLSITISQDDSRL